MAAFDTDFLTRITNVHWGGGLAVEFTQRPDYLSFGRSLNLNKATLSVWFRVPKASADAIEFLSSTPDFEVFDGIIPILVFGQQKQGTVTNWTWTTIGYTLGPDDPPFFEGGPPTSPVQEIQPSGSHSGALAPTFIGVDKDGWLSIHLQTGDVGTPNNLGLTMSSYEMIFTETDPGAFVVDVETIYSNYTANQFTYPDSLGNAGLPTDWGVFHPSEQGFQVTFDQWHHLLLSWDIKGGNASHGYTHIDDFSEGHNFVDQSSLLYCAADGVNKNGDELPGMTVQEIGPNETISYCTYQVAGMSNFTGGPEIGHPSYSVGFTAGVVADGMYIPAAPQYQLTYPPYSGAGPDNSGGNPNCHPVHTVELAELQIFAGVTLDTSSATNRRAFIDFRRDDNGDPIDDTLRPVDPKEAESLIGRRPDILLHGSSKWINGKNTGSLGLDEDGNEIPTGQFEPTGTIKKYTPDPSIE